MDGWLFGSDLVSQGSQVSLEALVFALQGLHAGQVVAVVVGVEGLVLLLDPLLGFISIPAAAQPASLQPSIHLHHSSHWQHLLDLTKWKYVWMYARISVYIQAKP